MLIYNDCNKLKIKDIKVTDTVQDYLNALDLYLKENPLPCKECTNNCCKRNWSIAVDNVYFLKKTKNNPHNKEKFFKRECFQIWRGESLMPYYSIKNPSKNSCKDLDGLNRCSIYENRPLICRTYTCIKKDDKLELMSNLIGETAKYSFAYNYISLLSDNSFFKKAYEDNPFYNMDNYNIPIRDILEYASTSFKTSFLEDEIEYLNELLRDFGIIKD